MINSVTIDTKLVSKSPGIHIFYTDGNGSYFNEDVEVSKEDIDKSSHWVLFHLTEAERTISSISIDKNNIELYRKAQE